MATLSICLWGNPVLRTRATEVTTFDAPRKALYGQMLETMHGARGIGIAAPQVGWTERAFVIDLGPVSTRTDIVGICSFDGKSVAVRSLMPLIVLNPVLTRIPEEKVFAEEGCLSIPGLSGPVERPLQIGLRFQDLDGKEHMLECEKLLARCIQHERDHLDGILWVDHLSAAARARLQTRLDAIRSQGERQKIPSPLKTPDGKEPAKSP